MYLVATSHSSSCLTKRLPWQQFGFAKHIPFSEYLWKTKEWNPLYTATYCLYKDHFGEGAETGERVSHRAEDVAAWEGVDIMSPTSNLRRAMRRLPYCKGGAVKASLKVSARVKRAAIVS